MLSALLFSSCELTDEDQEEISELFDPGDLTGPGNVPLPPIPTGCFHDRFQQPEATVNNSLDILFVTDTSGSFNAERGQVADSIDAFVAALPSQVDYRVGVMLAHSSLSSYTGKLFSSRVAATYDEPLILDSQAMPVEDIRFHLRHKLTKIRGDYYSDGGEEGLFSFRQALEADQLAEHRNDGFFRQDAGLAVIFVADEQDICATFPEGVVPVPDGQNLEGPAKARDCDGINPESVLAKLNEVHGDRPLFVGGVIYNNLNTVPSGGENEFGYGYADIIKLANGMSIDLADSVYRDGMTEMGQLVSVKLNLQTEFTLSQTDVDPSSVQAYVDGAAVPFHYSQETNQVQLTELSGGPLSIVDITHCPVALPNDRVADVCEGGSFVAKSNIKLGISLDPNEGSAATIEGGFAALGHMPTMYSDAEIASGKPISDGINVLIIARKVVLSAVDQNYIDGVLNYLSQTGGSLITEYDGTALLFTDFAGNNPVISNLDPSLRLFSGNVGGGGALLPVDASTVFVNDSTHPITQGIPTSFNLGLRAGFAITEFDGEWLDAPANFVSQGFLDLVPKGTYPAVLAGRCGAGRIAGFTMTHFQVINQEPVATMINNAIYWVSGM